jgi:hypothetical protein
VTWEKQRNQLGQRTRRCRRPMEAYACQEWTYRIPLRTVLEVRVEAIYIYMYIYIPPLELSGGTQFTKWVSLCSAFLYQ